MQQCVENCAIVYNESTFLSIRNRSRTKGICNVDRRIILKPVQLLTMPKQRRTRLRGGRIATLRGRRRKTNPVVQIIIDITSSDQQPSSSDANEFNNSVVSSSNDVAQCPVSSTSTAPVCDTSQSSQSTSKQGYEMVAPDFTNPDSVSSSVVADSGIKNDECPVCLETCVHPSKLPCSHIFCFLCLKGLARSGQSCPMCRAPIPYSYANQPILVSMSDEPTPSTSTSFASDSTTEEKSRWFYQAKHGSGWWEFEDRMSDEIEENVSSGNASFETMICGSLYVIDTISMIQYPKNCPFRARKILREVPSRVYNCKGVAGVSMKYVSKNGYGEKMP